MHSATPSSWSHRRVFLDYVKKKEETPGRIWSLEFLCGAPENELVGEEVDSFHSQLQCSSCLLLPTTVRARGSHLLTRGRPATVTSTWVLIRERQPLCSSSSSVNALLAAPPRISAASRSAAVTSSPSCLSFIFLVRQLFKVVFPSCHCVSTAVPYSPA